MVTFTEAIRAVYDARNAADRLDEQIKESRSQWEHDNEALLTAQKVMAEVRAETEAALREMALIAYAADPTNKAPAPGVGIRVTNRLEYDPKDAYSWAVSHEMALQLDKRAFEKIADVTMLDFVEKKEEAIATIATDLSKYVERED